MKLKKQTRVAMILLVVVALLVGNAAGCANEKGDYFEKDMASHNQNISQEQKLLPVLSNDAEHELKLAHVVKKSREGGEKPDASSISVIKYYGEYEGVQIFTMNCECHGIYCAPWQCEIGGKIFYYPNAVPISVYNGVNFYSLKQAFELDIVSKEVIEKVWNIHIEYYPEAQKGLEIYSIL